ncbi:uncharacterized protein [Hetaerina americana]|uniref:uncharacterized protein n=1 Tax=Hetaerina americana TaxID=62018 RepID=UPI003A7F192B
MASCLKDNRQSLACLHRTGKEEEFSPQKDVWLHVYTSVGSPLDVPQQPMTPPGLPPLLSKPSTCPESCTGNEKSSVAPPNSQVNPPPMVHKDLLTRKPRNDQNDNSNSESSISQALVPYNKPSETQPQESPTVPANKPSRSRKGYPQRSRNNNPPRNTYLQPPHFIRQLASLDDEPFAAQVPEISPQSQEKQNQPFLPQSSSTTPANLSTQTEKTEAPRPQSCCRQSPFPLPHPPTPLSHPPTPIPQPPTSVPHPPTPLPHPSTPLPHPSTPLPHPSTPLPHPSTPLPHPSTPLSHPPTPVPHPPTPVPHPSTPLSHPPTPVPHPPTPVPHPPTPVPFASIPLSSGGRPNFPEISIVPLPDLGSNPQQTSPRHASSYPEVNNYYSSTLPHQTPPDKVIPEAHRGASISDILNSQAQPSSRRENQAKHEKGRQRRGPMISDQFYRPGNENSGPSNAVLQLPNSNATFLGTEARPFNAMQNSENLAALPPNFYQDATMSSASAQKTNSQSTSTKPSFLNPHYKPSIAPTPPIIPGNYNERANRKSANLIPSAQNPVDLGGWASNLPLPTQNPQPSVSDLTAANFDNDVPKNYSKLATAVNQLPNFRAAFLNQNPQLESTSQSTLPTQSTAQVNPPRYSRPARRNTRKNADRSNKDPIKPPLNSPSVSYGGLSAYNAQPESAASIAHFCAQLNCQLSYPPIRPPHPASAAPPPPPYPENALLPPPNALPAPPNALPPANPLPPPNPFPFPRFNAPLHGGPNPLPPPPAGPQQNQQPLDSVRGSCMAILSATSIIMPPPPPNPPNFLFPPNYEMEMMARQHQFHRQQMAAGLDLFSETLRNTMDPTRKL